MLAGKAAANMQLAAPLRRSVFRDPEFHHQLVEAKAESEQGSRSPPGNVGPERNGGAGKQPHEEHQGAAYHESPEIRFHDA